MKDKTQILLWQIAGSLVFLVLLAVGSLLVYRAQYPYREEPRAEMRQLDRIIHLGDTPDQVETKFKAQNFDHLTLVRNAHKETIWEVRTPFEYAGQNWLIWIVFKDGVVHGVVIGTENDILANPKGAPPDKMTEGLRELVKRVAGARNAR